MPEKKSKKWEDLTHLQQETLKAFSEFHTKDTELSLTTEADMEVYHELCIHAVITENLRFIYGWKICKPCLMQLFKIRKELVKKEKLNVPA